MNLSYEINQFIQNYENPNFSKIHYGDVLCSLVKHFDRIDLIDEERCIESLKELEKTWLKYNYIIETTSAKTLESIFSREAKTVEDIEKIIKDEFEIFEIKIIEDKEYKNRFEIIYYRNPSYNKTRHYISVVLITEENSNSIKKILNISKNTEKE